MQLDSLKVMNRARGGDTVLFYPDTVLVLDNTVGIPEPVNDHESFRILTCYPNPNASYSICEVF